MLERPRPVTALSILSERSFDGRSPRSKKENQYFAMPLWSPFGSLFRECSIFGKRYLMRIGFSTILCKFDIQSSLLTFYDFWIFLVWSQREFCFFQLNYLKPTPSQRPPASISHCFITMRNNIEIDCDFPAARDAASRNFRRVRPKNCWFIIARESVYKRLDSCRFKILKWRLTSRTLLSQKSQR